MFTYIPPFFDLSDNLYGYILTEDFHTPYFYITHIFRSNYSGMVMVYVRNDSNYYVM